MTDTLAGVESQHHPAAGIDPAAVQEWVWRTQACARPARTGCSSS